MNKEVEYNFLKSAITLSNPFMSNTDFMQWLEEKKASTHHKIEQIPFSELNNWEFEEESGNLVHSSRKFFSIEGIKK